MRKHVRTRIALGVPLALVLAGAACGTPVHHAPTPPPPARVPPPHEPGCPPEMAKVEAYCVDRWEASVVVVGPDGAETPHSPYETIEADLVVRAKSVPGVFPQAYVSRGQAAAACAQAGKRLCTAREFVRACSGGEPGVLYPYGGSVRKKGLCNEGKGSSMVRFFGWDPHKWTEDDLNDPRLNQWHGGLAKTGEYTGCVSPEGVYDCVGNLHEWVDEADPQGHGRFRGGFYGDAENNGSGCTYVTRAHAPSYHDYSTGFRCCRDVK